RVVPRPDVSVRSVDDEDEHPGRRMVLAEGLRQHAGIREVALRDDRAGREARCHVLPFSGCPAGAAGHDVDSVRREGNTASLARPRRLTVAAGSLRALPVHHPRDLTRVPISPNPGFRGDWRNLVDSTNVSGFFDGTRGVDPGCAGPRRRPPIVAEASGCVHPGPGAANGCARLAAMRARVAVLRTRPETVVADYGRLLRLAEYDRVLPRNGELLL